MSWVRHGDKLDTNAELAMRVFGVARVERQAKEIPTTGYCMVTVEDKCYRDYCQSAGKRLKAVLEVGRVQRTDGALHVSAEFVDSRVLVEVCLS